VHTSFLCLPLLHLIAGVGENGTPMSQNRCTHFFFFVAGGSSEGKAGESGETMSQMMEQMMRDPEMQKMLYPYLPEPMRNPTSIEWMLSNPEVKKHMSDMFESQVHCLFGRVCVCVCVCTCACLIIGGPWNMCVAATQCKFEQGTPK
jgi:hypothetical protein